MHKTMIKCLPGLGRHGAAGDPIDIRYEVRFHSVNNLPELEQGKTLLIGTLSALLYCTSSSPDAFVRSPLSGSLGAGLGARLQPTNGAHHAQAR
jgi:hypothetical protein